jgi:hypothetical protein
MFENKSFTKEEVSENIGDEEVDIALQGLLDKGLLEIAGYDKDGEPLYRCTELGVQISEHFDSDPNVRN